MTKESAKIKRLEALLAKKNEKEKAASAKIKKLEASIMAKDKSSKKWKDKYKEWKKESNSNALCENLKNVASFANTICMNIKQRTRSTN